MGCMQVAALLRRCRAGEAAAAEQAAAAEELRARLAGARLYSQRHALPCIDWCNACMFPAEHSRRTQRARKCPLASSISFSG